MIQSNTKQPAPGTPPGTPPGASPETVSGSTPGDQPDTVLRWLGSLADATRIRLLKLMERHELGVSDLCEVLQMPQSTVSRHLKLLADEGWITSRRQATTNLYRMVPDELTPAQRELWTLTREQTDAWATLHQDRVRLTHQLREQKRDAKAFFDSVAAKWEKTRREHYGETYDFHALVGLLPSDWVVADLGCGNGSLSALLGEHVAKVLGIDSSEPMLQAARERNTEMSNVEFRHGDLEAVPVDDGGCDAAICVLVLTYVPDPAGVLAEMSRIVKDGGKVVVVDLLKHDRDDFRREMGQQNLGFTPSELRSLMNDAGFSRVKCSPLPPAPQAKGPALLIATAHHDPAGTG